VTHIVVIIRIVEKQAVPICGLRRSRLHVYSGTYDEDGSICTYHVSKIFESILITMLYENQDVVKHFVGVFLHFLKGNKTFVAENISSKKTINHLTVNTVCSNFNMYGSIHIYYTITAGNLSCDLYYVGVTLIRPLILFSAMTFYNYT
jgi:hypothetical protein